MKSSPQKNKAKRVSCRPNRLVGVRDIMGMLPRLRRLGLGHLESYVCWQFGKYLLLDLFDYVFHFFIQKIKENSSDHDGVSLGLGLLDGGWGHRHAERRAVHPVESRHGPRGQKQSRSVLFCRGSKRAKQNNWSYIYRCITVSRDTAARQPAHVLSGKWVLFNYRNFSKNASSVRTPMLVTNKLIPPFKIFSPYTRTDSWPAASTTSWHPWAKNAFASVVRHTSGGSHSGISVRLRRTSTAT